MVWRACHLLALTKPVVDQLPYFWGWRLPGTQPVRDQKPPRNQRVNGIFLASAPYPGRLWLHQFFGFRSVKIGALGQDLLTCSQGDGFCVGCPWPGKCHRLEKHEECHLFFGPRELYN